MRLLRRIASLAYVPYAALTFVVTMFLVLPFVLVSAFFGIAGGNFIYFLCRCWARAWYFLIGIRHIEIHLSPIDESRQYIFVANHGSYMDIPAAILAICQPVRILGKYEMVKIPVFGWIYRAAVILVDRRDVERRARSVRALKAAMRRGISIFIFPEGTFNETGEPLKDFFDGAFRLAIETQQPIKPLLFIDTGSRQNYHTIFSLNPGKSRVIYLPEVEVTGYTMAQVRDLKEHVHRLMEDGLTTYRAGH